MYRGNKLARSPELCLNRVHLPIQTYFAYFGLTGPPLATWDEIAFSVKPLEGAVRLGREIHVGLFGFLRL